MAKEMENPNESTFKRLQTIVQRCHSTADIGLNYVPMKRNALRLALYTDASFANIKSLKSQIGFVLALTDGTGLANLVHYGSSRCKRVARSVMAAALHALVYGFDQAFIVRDI